MVKAQIGSNLNQIAPWTNTHKSDVEVITPLVAIEHELEALEVRSRRRDGYVSGSKEGLGGGRISIHMRSVYHHDLHHVEFPNEPTAQHYPSGTDGQDAGSRGASRPAIKVD